MKRKEKNVQGRGNNMSKGPLAGLRWGETGDGAGEETSPGRTQRNRCGPPPWCGVS